MEFKDLLTNLSGYWVSRSLLTAVELDLFTHIHRGSSTIDTLATTSGTSLRGLKALLPCLISLELIEDGPGGYSLTESGKLLSTLHPQHRLGIFWHHINLWKKWNRLTDSVTTGDPTPGDLDLESFILAMAHVKTESFTDYFREISLEGVKKILDLGGGPGSFALNFMEAAPDAEVVLFDLPEVIALADRILSSEVKESGRMTLKSGNFLSDSFGKGYDLIWVSSIIHQYGDEETQEIMDRCYHALNPGGRLVVRDFLLDPDKSGPLYPALFSLNMLVNTNKGRAYTTQEIRTMIENSGFAEAHVKASVAPSRLIVARRN